MKIILSRKGFDSSIGKVASPIFPDGEMCSLPIPEVVPGRCSWRYQEIKVGARSLGELVGDLTRGKIRADAVAHLDPDLHVGSVPRRIRWKPVFGQAGAAERHLQNKGVAEGDVFVFYGWFRQVEQCDGMFRYVKDAPDLHVIFGWLQIERRIAVAQRSAIPPWALDHPHCQRTESQSPDSIYISSDSVKLPKGMMDKPGAGFFRRFDPALRLTAPGRLRSVWRLPQWFYPGVGRLPMSYHESLGRWRQEEGYVLLQSVGRGQEFVLDCEEYPEAVDWLASILSVDG